MVLFLRVDKDANIKEEEIKDIENLYKSCGLRKKEGFVKLFIHNFNNSEIQLWGRNNGRNNIKNKLVFPLDNNLALFGTVAIVYLFNNNLEDLTLEKWNQICENFNKDKVDKSVLIKEPVANKDNIDNNSNSEYESDSDSDSNENDSSDSELQPEEYIYSSEEEN